MKNFKLSFLMIMTLVFSAASAQVPSYVPSSGLVGWWPFNGNANDESGNGNNGTVNGATPTTDRFGIQNSAYKFDGNDNIDAKSITPTNGLSVSCWTKAINLSSGGQIVTQSVYNDPASVTWEFNYLSNTSNHQSKAGSYKVMYGTTCSSSGTDEVWYNTLNVSGWNHIVFTVEKNGSTTIYLNGVNVASKSLTAFPNCSPYAGSTLRFGGPWHPNDLLYLIGSLDDIGIWNRALTNTEVQSLYKGCNLIEVTGNPTDSKLKSTQNATFTTAAVSGSTIQWQSNADNLGWTNVPSNSFYSGGTTASLTINNVQISNHNQKFRAIATNGPCKDTSTEAKIIITDTCINTKSVSVADTLKFAVNLTGVAPPNNRNAMKVYPNPTNSAVVIDNGNFTAMANYTVKIENSIGQQVFSSKVTHQQFTVDVSTLGGKGVYTLTVLDPAGKLLETKKIVLQ